MPACIAAWSRTAAAAIGALALLGGTPVAAQGTEWTPDRATLAQALELARSAAAQVAPAGARIVALPGTLDSRLRLADCPLVQPHLVAGVPALGATRVGLRCVQGPRRWNVFLPVQVQVFAPALVSRVALPAGAQIQPAQWMLAETDWAAGPTPPLAEAAAGRVLAHPIAAGQALRAGDLQPRRWFDSGQTVQVVAHGPGFAISTEGQALNHGIEGQPVRVRTEGGRILSGRATAAARVELAL